MKNKQWLGSIALLVAFTLIIVGVYYFTLPAGNRNVQLVALATKDIKRGERIDPKSFNTSIGITDANQKYCSPIGLYAAKDIAVNEQINAGNVTQRPVSLITRNIGLWITLKAPHTWMKQADIIALSVDGKLFPSPYLTDKGLTVLEVKAVDTETNVFLSIPHELVSDTLSLKKTDSYVVPILLGKMARPVCGKCCLARFVYDSMLIPQYKCK